MAYVQSNSKDKHQNDVLQIISDAAKQYPDSQNLVQAHAELLTEAERYAEALDACEKFLALVGCNEKLLDLALDLRHRIGSHNLSLPDGIPTVSLCMIVKDEAANLPRCLASAKAFVNDIVVVDTGSVDRTVDIAVAFGARVFDFQWDGDFSAARNYSISQARSPWILLLDADEVLAEYDYPLFVKTLLDSSGKQVAWRVTTRNYTNRAESEGWNANDGSYPVQEQGDGWYPSHKVRLFPASEKIRFHGDIHEMVETDLRALGIPIRQAGFVVHHYGELAEVDRRAKQMRYYQMGLKKLAERPDDFAAMAELAIQAGELELFAEALELWDRLLARGLTSRDIYFNRCYVLMGLKRFSEASDMARKALETDPHHKESAYNLGMCLLNLARPEQSLETVLKESARHPDYPLLRALLCVLYLCTGEHQSAKTLFNGLKNSNYAIADYISERLAVLERLGHMALAKQLRDAAIVLGVVNNR
jgi:glycosyltransferase involved in cell wall biosynthesis